MSNLRFPAVPAAALVLAGSLAVPTSLPARELPLRQIDRYRRPGQADQVTGIHQFSDVQPTDWAYQALSNLIERYGCVAGYPDGTVRGGRAMTRYEAAALLNACLDRITEVTDELKRLMKEFEKELAILRGRVDGLEAKVGELEATRFFTTTTLRGQATFVVGSNGFGGDATSAEFKNGLGPAEDLVDFVGADTFRELLASPVVDLRRQFLKERLDPRLRRVLAEQLGEERLQQGLREGTPSNLAKSLLIALYSRGGILPGESIALRTRALQGGTVVNYDLRLDLDTSFSGKDLLRTRLRAGNFGRDGAFGGQAVGLNGLEAGFQANRRDDEVAVDRLFYQFPLGSGFVASLGARVRQDDMLALWPSAYPAEPVLQLFATAGAPGAYDLNRGAGAGLWWRRGGFSISANTISANGNQGATSDLFGDCGGIGTDCAAHTSLLQLGYSGGNWAIAVAYAATRPNRIAGLQRSTATPLAQLVSTYSDRIDSYGVSGYWQPSRSGWLPSVSAGWGLNQHSAESFALVDGARTQSWYVGLQWHDALRQGNLLGFAVGQPTFLTHSGEDSLFEPQDGQYAWELWYAWQITDAIRLTPAVFYLSSPYGKLQRNDDDDTFNDLGGLLKATFRF